MADSGAANEAAVPDEEPTQRMPRSPDAATVAAAQALEEPDTLQFRRRPVATQGGCLHSLLTYMVRQRAPLCSVTPRSACCVAHACPANAGGCGGFFWLGRASPAPSVRPHLVGADEETQVFQLERACQA